jgi:hypothetical protein
VSKEFLDKLLAKFPQAVKSTHNRCGDETALIQREGKRKFSP